MHHSWAKKKKQARAWAETDNFERGASGRHLRMGKQNHDIRTARRRSSTAIMTRTESKSSLSYFRKQRHMGSQMGSEFPDSGESTLQQWATIASQVRCCGINSFGDNKSHRIQKIGGELGSQIDESELHCPWGRPDTRAIGTGGQTLMPHPIPHKSV